MILQDFDESKVANKNVRKIFKPLIVKKPILFKQAFIEGKVNCTEDLLIIETKSKSKLAFSKKAMAFHHIAQGYIDDEPYMLTFCVICNTGMIMKPVVDDKLLHFFCAGVHNGMMIMADKESNSYWDHITGECVFGKYKGKHLELIGSHQVMNSNEVMEKFPDMPFAISKMNVFQKLLSLFQSFKASPEKKGFLPPGFRKSIEQKDDRLTEMEMGIGVWTNKKAKFYPTAEIKKNGNVIIDQFEGKNLVVFISPSSYSPQAMFTKASTANWINDALVFDTNEKLENSKLFNSSNIEVEINAPTYTYSRWYGFSLTFPGCDVYSNDLSDSPNKEKSKITNTLIAF